jgi:hypothetical protein
MDAREEPVNRLDIGREKSLVLGELGARHGGKVRWRRGVAEVEGTGRVDKALLEALEHKGAVLKIVDRGKYEVMLQDEADSELGRLCGSPHEGERSMTAIAALHREMWDFIGMPPSFCREIDEPSAARSFHRQEVLHRCRWEEKVVRGGLRDSHFEIRICKKLR